MTLARKISRKLMPEDLREAADREIRRLQSEVSFDIRDFTIEHIVSQFASGSFYRPEYQRLFVWKTKHRAEFIESVILGLPIPMMFLAGMTDGRLEIVDGAQRIQTLRSFLNGELKLAGLRKLTSLNGFRFHDLSTPQQRKLSLRPLRIVILDESTTPQLRQELFDRINTRGERARPSEVRRGAYTGPFMEFVDKCATDPQFLSLCPVSQPLQDRREPQELVLRYFIYADHYRAFRHDVEHFLNAHVETLKDSTDLASKEADFRRMLDFVAKYFPSGFAKRSGATSTPRVRFEAISVGVTLALRECPSLVPGNMNWVRSAAFKDQTTTHASNSGPRLRGRIEYVRDQLLKGAKNASRH